MASPNPGTLRIRSRAKKLREEERVSPLIAEACAGIDELLEAAEAGRPLADLCSIRTRRLERNLCLGGGQLGLLDRQ